MKKVVALVLSMVLLGSFAMAETFNFDGMSDDELSELIFEANAEIAERGIEKTATLVKGVYVVGVDLPVGSYHFTSDGKDGEYGIFFLQPKTIDPELTLQGPRAIYDSASVERNSEYYITLEEGDTLSLPYQFKATICAGIKFE